MADTLPSFWGRQTFCLITGASQGIGRQLAVEFAKKVGNRSLFILLARSESGLKETQALIESANPDVYVTSAPSDLLNPDAAVYTEIIRNSLLEFKLESSSFGLAMLVHNAGSIGDVAEMTRDMSEPRKWSDYLTVNLVSTICLNSVFLNAFPAETSKEVCVVNITSLCGIQPFKAMAHYCVGKASREMFFRVLALENPSLNVISYSPGPVDTDMQTTVAANIGDPEMREMYATMRETGKILSTEQTTKRCVKILAERKYKSGDHVDYFDEI